MRTGLTVPPRAGVIGDLVWKDVNANGIQDEGDPGIPGVEVYLFDENCYPIGKKITDDNGSYRFDGLPSGNYYVCVNLSNLPELKDGAQWWPTVANVGYDDSVDSDSLLVNEDDPLYFRMV